MKMSAVLQKHFTQQRKKVNVQDKLFLSYFCPILFLHWMKICYTFTRAILIMQIGMI